MEPCSLHRKLCLIHAREGECSADRYCWLHIISTHARVKAGASSGMSHLLFQLIIDTGERQKDEGLPNPIRVCPIKGGRRCGQVVPQQRSWDRARCGKRHSWL